MKIVFYNIERGLLRKMEALEVFMKEEMIDVIGLGETDILKEEPVPDIPGYISLYERDVPKIRVVVYVREGLPVVQFAKASAVPAVLLRIGQMSISVIYNEFTHQQVRLTNLERRERVRDILLEHDKNATQPAVVLGDWNIEWTKNSVERTLMESWAATEGYVQRIEEITRPSGGSMIDLIFTRGDNIRKCSVIEPGLSDHRAIMCHVSKKSENPQRKLITQERITQPVIDWARINRPQYLEVEEISTLYNRLQHFMDEIVKMSRTQRWIKVSDRPPWYDNELRQMKLAVCGAKREEKKRLRNQYVAALRRAKRRFEGERMRRSSRGVWQIIRKKSGGQAIELEDGGGRIVGEEAAEELRNFFKNKQEKLRKEPQPEEIKRMFGEHLCGSEHWELKPLDHEGMLKMIDGLSPKRSSGRDGISYYLLKQFKFEVAGILQCIINKSMREGIFLDEWKIGRVIPLYKGKGDRSGSSSYRPVTLTSVVGRLVEKAIQGQMDAALEARGAFSEAQYGFRKGKGTAKCLEDCIEEIRMRKVEGRKVAIVAVDGSNAFEQISRELLLDLVAMTGAAAGVLRWMKNYFTNRRQYVEVDGHISTEWEVNTGSIQGSILSPGFFNVISMTQTLCNNRAKSFQFADDETEVISANTEEECNEAIREVATTMCKWYDQSGLTVNPKKSEVIGFNFTPQPVRVAGEVVKPVEQIRFLGLKIRSDLKWTDHIADLCGSIRRAAGRIRVEGRHMGQKQRTILYHAWIGGRLHANASTYLTQLMEQELHKVQVACNAAIRAVLGVARRGEFDVEAGRRKLGISSVRQIRRQYELMAAWERREELSREARLGRATRRRTGEKVVTPDQRGQRRLLTGVRAAIAWNDLSQEIRNTDDRKLAWRWIKSWVKDNYNL